MKDMDMLAALNKMNAAPKDCESSDAANHIGFRGTDMAHVNVRSIQHGSKNLPTPKFCQHPKDYRSKSGIYMIRNLATNKRRDCYIGQASSLETRMWSQFYAVKHGKRLNQTFLADVATFGADSFEIKVIEVCPKSRLSRRESYWIRRCKSKYNLVPVDWRSEPVWKIAHRTWLKNHAKRCADFRRKTTVEKLFT